MMSRRGFAVTTLVLFASCGLLTHARLEAQIATSGTVVVTFNVPVQLASLDPKFTELDVHCFALAPTAATTTPSTALPPTAQAKVAMSNGAFSGTVPMQITLAASSGQTWGYRCGFSLLDSATGKYWIYSQTPGGSLGPNAEGRLQALAQPGAHAAYEQAGSFTVQ